MACNLWGPSYDQDVDQSSYQMQPGWQYGFRFGYGFDMIEENALNEESCIQVLRILIRKADSEIDELEKDLVTLQSELALAEYDEWYEICCSVLKKKVDYLDISLRTLRNKDKDDLEAHLLMHTEPAEKLHEILKAQLRSYYREKDEQPQDAVVLNSASGTTGHASGSLHEDQHLSVSDLHIKAKEEISGSSIIPKENCTSLNQSDGLQAKKTDNLELVKLANADSEDQTQDSVVLVADPSNEKKVCTKLTAECSVKQEAKEHNYSLEDKTANHYSLLKSAGKTIHNLEWVEPAEVIVKNTIVDGHLDKKKKLNASGLKILRDDVKEHSLITATDVRILDSSSKHMGCGAVLSKEVKPVNIIFKNPGSNAPKQLTSHSDEVKQRCFDSKCDAHEVQEYGASVAGDSKTSSSSLIPERQGNILQADKPGNAMAKSISPDILRYGTGLNKRKDNSEPWLQAFRDAKTLNCDIEQKICDFAVKAARKRSIKDLKIASTGNIVLPNLSLKAASMRKDPQQVLKVKEAVLSDTENSALTSLLALHDERRKDKTILQQKEEKAQIGEGQIADNSANNEKLITYFSMKKAKKNVETNPQNAHGPDAIPEENIGSSSISKARRPWQYAEMSGMNNSLNGRMTKKIVQHIKGEAEKHNVIRDDRQNFCSPPLKKSKKASSVPIILEIRSSVVQIDLSKSHGNPTDGRGKAEFSISKSHSVDNSCTEVVDSSLPSATSNLNDLKLSDLRAIAKGKKLKKYHKLRKSDLVDLIISNLSC